MFVIASGRNAQRRYPEEDAIIAWAKSRGYSIEACRHIPG